MGVEIIVALVIGVFAGGAGVNLLNNNADVVAECKKQREFIVGKASYQCVKTNELRGKKSR